MNQDIKAQTVLLDILHKELQAQWEQVRSYLEHEDVEAAWDCLSPYFDVTHSVFSEQNELRIRLRRDWARVKRIKRENSSQRDAA